MKKLDREPRRASIEKSTLAKAPTSQTAPVIDAKLSELGQGVSEQVANTIRQYPILPEEYEWHVRGEIAQAKELGLLPPELIAALFETNSKFELKAAADVKDFRNKTGLLLATQVKQVLIDVVKGPYGRSEYRPSSTYSWAAIKFGNDRSNGRPFRSLGLEILNGGINLKKLNGRQMILDQGAQLAIDNLDGENGNYRGHTIRQYEPLDPSHFSVVRPIHVPTYDYGEPYDCVRDSSGRPILTEDRSYMADQESRRIDGLIGAMKDPNRRVISQRYIPPRQTGSPSEYFERFNLHNADVYVVEKRTETR